MLQSLLVVIALAASVTISAQEVICQPIPPLFPRSKISRSAIQNLIEQLRHDPAIACRDFGSHVRQCSGTVQNSTMVRWIFTLPGHPAHPAMSHAEVHFDTNCVSRDGYFAGSAAAFADLMRKLKNSDDALLMREVVP